MKHNALYLCAAILTMAGVVSCGQRTDKNRNTERANAETMHSRTAEQDTISLDLTDGYATSQMHKDSMQTLWFRFASPGSEKLFGRITLPAKDGNVRFNQIVMPGGKADGPFGRDITYTLADSGTYLLSVGESLMQGDPYDGNFTVELFTGKEVPYAQVVNYFVRNDVEGSETMCMKIDTQKQFDALFGAAATMTSKPEAIDFSKEFLLAVIGPATDTATSYEPVAVISKDGIVTLVYNEMTGAEQSFTIRPYMLLKADKSYDGTLRVIKANE